MKKLLLSFTAVLAAISLNAQVDTLSEFFTGTPTLYSAQGGGVVTGNNAYGDLGKGMRFNSQTGLTSGGVISNVLLWIPSKVDGGGSFTVKVHAYSVTDTLGAELGSATVSLASVDTNVSAYSFAAGRPFNVNVAFATPINIPAGKDVIVMVYLPTGANAIAITSNTSNDFALSATHTFEIWSDNTIHDFMTAWQNGVNVAMAMYPVVNFVVGLEEKVIEASVFPNPANDLLNVTSTEEIANVTILTMDGKVVASSDVATVNVADLNAGLYIYTVTTVSGRIANGTFAKN